MILDVLENAQRYLALHPRFDEAFRYLEVTDLASLEPGRHAIQNDYLYAMVVEDTGRGREAAQLEVHQTYIDIQYTVEGCDEIGWRDVGTCHSSQGHQMDGDCELFKDRPVIWIPTPPRTFAIFFPEDAHAPMGGTGKLRKVIVKVRKEG